MRYIFYFYSKFTVGKENAAGDFSGEEDNPQFRGKERSKQYTYLYTLYIVSLNLHLNGRLAWLAP